MRDEYVIYTCRETMNLLNWCKEHNVEVWSPTKLVRKNVGSKQNPRYEDVRVPQLYGYCFAPMHRWKRIMNSIPHWFMVQPMGFSRVTARPDNCTLDQLHRLNDALLEETAPGAPVSDADALGAGDAVVVTAGPFESMEGSVVDTRNTGVRVLLGRHYVTLPEKILRKRK